MPYLRTFYLNIMARQDNTAWKHSISAVFANIRVVRLSFHTIKIKCNMCIWCLFGCCVYFCVGLRIQRTRSQTWMYLASDPIYRKSYTWLYYIQLRILYIKVESRYIYCIPGSLHAIATCSHEYVCTVLPHFTAILLVSLWLLYLYLYKNSMETWTNVTTTR